jgi:dipeptidyl aminopeptidase/acylaminoacyl peptidase
MPRLALAMLAVALASPVPAELPRFQPADLFQMQWAGDPNISPDGRRIVYVRHHADIMADRYRQNLWLIDTDGANHQPLTTGSENHTQPRWSADGTRIAYVGNQDGSMQLYVRWVDTGREARISQLTQAPSGIAWSPDGTHIAFSMFVPSEARPFVQMPAAPRGAQWAERAQFIERLVYRRDGRGYLQAGHQQIFIVPADGGAPLQVTRGDFDHGGPVSWTPDGRALVFAANRREDADYEPRLAALYRLDLDSGELSRLLEWPGPVSLSRVSPDGRRIAFTGFEDRELAYQQDQLYVVDMEGGGLAQLAAGLDRSIGNFYWSTDSRGLYFQYDDQGTTKVGYADLAGRSRELVAGLGGMAIGRPYPGGSFTASGNGRLAFTQASTSRPAELASYTGRGAPRRLTALNETLLGQRQLGEVEEFWYESSVDGRPIHGWIIKPPGFDPVERYPLVLEIHGGPHANYGPRFTVELQSYAAAGYVVLYTNPRGSSSYGQAFADLIHHAYPGHDHDDLMDGIDAVIARGYVDPERLYITGGSGGGVLTSWAIGMTDRFRAAVVQKPVINWYSMAFVTDIPVISTRYWFGAMPWEDPKEYLRRSPISLVGNVTTPTMVLTGEHDWRTPMSESEQYYQALKLRRVDAALVRIPEAPHAIGHRPSNMIDQVLHIIGWFERYDKVGNEGG